MNAEKIKFIVSKLPPQYIENAVRDICPLTCSIFGETHFDSFPKLFDIKFSIIYWYPRKDGNVIFYRSGQEYQEMAKRMGERYIKNPKMAIDVSETLMKMTDQINEFVKTNTSLSQLVEKWNWFWPFYRDFFSYHQSAYWPGDYLAKNNPNPSTEVKKIISALDQAYKYNEQIVPLIEKYFTNMKISRLFYDEITPNIIGKIPKKPSRRYLLFLDNKKEVLSSADGEKLHQSIEDEMNRYLSSITEIKGFGASPGIVKGKARVIIDLSKLGECKPEEILVTTQTRPQFNATLKNVRAIITDEGGLLCHASMLAREFHIPCVVGTKIATRSLKTGDNIEVNASLGQVKLLK